MTGSASSLRVHCESWMPEHVALLCGIANAGGGVLIVASTNKNYSQGLRRMRKPFEQIPILAQQELGIVCTTEPVLEGPTLCLEINIPATDAHKPIRYRGAYRYYDDASGRNLSLSVEEIAQRRATGQAMPFIEPEPKGAGGNELEGVSALGNAAQAATRPAIDSSAIGSPEQTSTSSQLEDLFSMFSELAAKFEHAGGAVTVSAEAGSVTFAFPRPANETKVRSVNPEGETFAERSVAAANGFDLTSTDEYILRVLRTNGRATAPRIAEVLGVSESTVRRSFKRLKELALIERVGSAKAGYWRVNA